MAGSLTVAFEFSIRSSLVEFTSTTTRPKAAHILGTI
jgi:hypothetical protein